MTNTEITKLLTDHFAKRNITDWKIISIKERVALLKVGKAFKRCLLYEAKPTYCQECNTPGKLYAHVKGEARLYPTGDDRSEFFDLAIFKSGVSRDHTAQCSIGKKEREGMAKLNRMFKKIFSQM